MPWQSARNASRQRIDAPFEIAHVQAMLAARINDEPSAIVASFAAQLGFILLCIGVVFTAFWARTVAAYAFAQTYRLANVR